MSRPDDNAASERTKSGQHDQSPGGDRPPDRPRRPRDPQGESDRARLVGQLRIILQARPDAAVWPPIGRIEAGAPLEYVYRQGRILCRDDDLASIARFVEGRVVDALGVGVTAYAPADGDVQAALTTVDRELGRGIATPDHFLWLTARSSCCPATEPLPVDKPVPHPPVRRDRRSSGDGVSVSVVDTGLISTLTSDGAHTWLTSVVGDEETYTPSDIEAYVGHGTFIAGIVRCIAPRSEVRVEGFLTQGATLGADGTIINKITGGALTESEIVAQLYDSIATMPDVISMSAGCTTRGDLGLLTFEAFYETSLRAVKGPVLVVAAGNDASRRPFYPAAYEWTLSVGALDQGGTRAAYSNFGPWVDVYALGSDIVNAFPVGTYVYKEPPPPGQAGPNVGDVADFKNGMARWSGTSFATPIVAGMIAARMSATGQTARAAANSVLRIARAHAKPGIGAIADPAMLTDADPAGDFWP